MSLPNVLCCLNNRYHVPSVIKKELYGKGIHSNKQSKGLQAFGSTGTAAIDSDFEQTNLF